MMHPEAERLIVALDLQRHPEGGWYRETWRAETEVAAPRGVRSAGTSILYLLADGAVSNLHRVTGDEVWYLQAGGPVDIHMLEGLGSRTVRLDGAIPRYQFVVPGGTWFGAELAASDGYALAGCAVAPGFEFSDFELGRRAPLLAAFPAAADLITRLTSEEESS
jgi:predicted cupin superfamily sugar epimerase